MRVVHINTYDIRGGAARAVRRLHRGLQQLGVESSMLVAHRISHDESVMPIALSGDFGSRLKRRRRPQAMSRDLAPYAATRPAGLELFSTDRSIYQNDVVSSLPPCDIVHLHWIAEMVDYQSFFTQLPRDIPIVWTFHDMNAFTGGCHYNMDCDRYKRQCGACPQLGSSREEDLSRQVWRRKQRVFAQLDVERLHIVTPSRWLQREVSASSLLGRFPSSVIPNGLDTAVFSPRPRDATRQALGISPTARVLLFAADSLATRRKGFDLLMQTLAALNRIPNVLLLSVGGDKPELEMPIPHLHLGHISNDVLLPLAYNAADVFVIPSLQDNLPNTVLESMSCGTPVIGFDVGGIPDMVRPGLTGELVPVGDVSALGQTIADLLGDDSRRAAMSVNCRRVAVGEYSAEAQAQSCAELYRALLQANA